MTRRQFTTFSAISLSVILLSARSGFAQSGRWALLATGVVAMFLASFAAPEYFGWRGPDDAELHQRRRQEPTEAANRDPERARSLGDL